MANHFRIFCLRLRGYPLPDVALGWWYVGVGY
jgi:hypothetical protein